LEDMEASDIENDAPLFGDDGLGLDSIDALEIIVLLESQYKLKLENPEEGKTVFHSINSLAEYISANRA
ncbi:MAG: phosphopantetheine-binding protein, partial [Chitinophagales bacterium]